MKNNILLSVFILTFFKIFAQTNPSDQFQPKINNVPTSPEVALLGRFGDIPIGHYTGTAEISVPLYNINVDGVNIPLNISYHTSGIKVADEATWVGLGWNLMPGGTIYKEIRGKEDTNSPLELSSYIPEYDIFKNNFPSLFVTTPYFRLQKGEQKYINGSMIPNPGITDDRSTIINRLLEGYGQPDIYNYNFLGYIGKFIINPENGKIELLNENSNIKFIKDINGWIAITNNGYKYYFFAQETASSETAVINVGRTFKLNKIETVEGKEITFSYTDENNYMQFPIETALLTNFGMAPSTQVNINSTFSRKKNLTQIKTDNLIINFNLENREDIKSYNPNTPAKRLSSIDILSLHNGKKIKSWIFNYSYFIGSGGKTSPNLNVNSSDAQYNKRLRLDSLKEINYDSQENPLQQIPPYTFDYELSIQMPSKLSTAVDFYGYYNGENYTNNTLLPDLDYFNYLNNVPYKNVNMNVNYPYVGGKRFTNQNYISSNILKKITYPTKGYTEFDYESNTFSNQFIPDKFQMDAIHKDIEINNNGQAVNPSQAYHREFTLNRVTTIKFYNKIYDGYTGISNPNMPVYTYQQMQNSYIALSKVKLNTAGQAVTTLIKKWAASSVTAYNFSNDHGVSWEEDITIPYDPDPNVKYVIETYNSTPYSPNDTYGIAGVKSRFIYESDADIDKSISYGHGLRVKTIKNYDYNGTLVKQRSFNYYGGKLLYKFEPLNLISGATHKSQVEVYQGGCILENIAVFNSVSVNSFDFGINGNNSFGYSIVEEVENQVGLSNTKGLIKYNFSNIENFSIKGLPKIDNAGNGENILTEYYNHLGNKVFSKSTSYSLQAGIYNIFPSFTVIHTSLGAYDPYSQIYPYSMVGCGIYNGQLVYTYQNQINTTKYNFTFTPLIQERRRLTSELETQYLNGNEVSTKKEYFYNSNGDINSTKITYSDGNESTLAYMYAQEKNNQLMIDKNMLDIPLEITNNKKTNGVFKMISKQEIVYPISQTEADTKTSGLALPYLVKSTDLLGINSSEVTYDKYDLKGNLLQYTTKGIPVAIIWGYNSTQPIAKIEGATYAQVSSLAAAIVTASNTDALAASNNDETTLLAQLDAFRKNTSLANYQITTYTYDPLIGVRSITPPSGIREVYKYDSANRLENIKDVNGKILKEFKYNYKP